MKKHKIIATCIALLLLFGVLGCGEEDGVNMNNTMVDSGDNTTTSDSAGESSLGEAAGESLNEAISKTGLDNESASDGNVDFQALLAENEDVVAWLLIPGTSIDVPILQSGVSDDYYTNHNAHKESDDKGAVFMEMPNMMDFCDFNTVIHGKGEEGTPFFELVNFENPDYFDANETFNIFLDGNVLTYEVLSCYRRENTSLIRQYDYTTVAGCQEFLDDMYSDRIMGKQMREDMEAINPYNFLVTLTIDDDSADSQLVVVGVLVDDAAGTIDRIMYE